MSVGTFAFDSVLAVYAVVVGLPVCAVSVCAYLLDSVYACRGVEVRGVVVRGVVATIGRRALFPPLLYILVYKV